MLDFGRAIDLSRLKASESDSESEYGFSRLYDFELLGEFLHHLITGSEECYDQPTHREFEAFTLRERADYLKGYIVSLLQ